MKQNTTPPTLLSSPRVSHTALLLVICASLGFFLTNHWNQKEELLLIRNELQSSKKALIEQLSSQSEQNNRYYLSLLKLSDELDKEQKRLATLEKELAQERTEHQRTLKQFQTQLNQTKDKMQSELSKTQKDLSRVQSITQQKVKDLDEIGFKVDENKLLIKAQAKRLITQNDFSPPAHEIGGGAGGSFE